MNIDQNIVSGVIEEAISCLDPIRENIAAYRENPTNFDQLETAFRDAQSIKGAASMIEQTDVYDLAKDIELRLRAIAANRIVIDDDAELEISSRLNTLERILNEKRSLPTPEEILENFDIFSTPVEMIVAQEKTPSAWEDFDIDPETLEIFSLEAEDLLRNINDSLRTLGDNPANFDALMEIRRSAHTLKGSAAIVGMKPLSALAHRMEDLLDLLTEQKLSLSGETHSLLSDSMNSLAGLARGEVSAELDQNIKKIYQRYETMMTTLADASENEVEEVEETVVHQEIIVREENEDIHVTGKPAARHVIRISLERLDELMRLFSEVLQGRAVIEQRLNDMEKQLLELQHSTDRLRHSSGKLEIDFEAGMMKNSPSKIGVLSSGFVAGDSKEFDELEFDRYTEFHQVTRQLVETGSDVASINIEMEGLLTNLESAFGGQRHLIDEIQKRLMQLRMVSFDSLARRLQHTVRMTADQEEKLIDVFIDGGEVEVDSQILDSLTEPLLHILRNAVSHGIEAPDTRKLLGKPESGLIKVLFTQEENFVLLTVSDDGRGIQVSDLRETAVRNNFVTQEKLATMSDSEVMELVFLPGLSTSTEVSEVSGRGVGMNIVKESLARHQGTIAVASDLKRGTTFTLKLPVALSVTRAIPVRAGREIYALPLNLVKQVVEISYQELEEAKKENVISIEGKLYSLSHLNDLTNIPHSHVSKDTPNSVLLLRSGGELRAVVVEELLPPQEIVLKPLCFPLEKQPGFLGASILGNGRVVPVLDLDHLLKPSVRQAVVEAKPKVRSEISVMVVDDSPSVRRIMTAVINGAGWEVITAKDGIEAFELLQNGGDLPHVVLTDVEMPRMDGYELLATLKRTDDLRKIPVIMITSRAGEKHRRKALDLGVSDYVTKPYEDSSLLATIKRLAENKR